jgi:hypothetical protein
MLQVLLRVAGTPDNEAEEIDDFYCRPITANTPSDEELEIEISLSHLQDNRSTDDADGQTSGII